MAATHTRVVVAAVALTVATPACLYPQVPEVFEAGAPLDDGAVGPEGGEAIPEFNNCTPAMYVDRSADAADRTVGFGSMAGAPEFGFAPACITIAAGQTVTFQGDMSIHPLRPGTGPEAPTAGSPSNPIPPTTSGTMVAVAFPVPGTYPFYCAMHYASGMAGVVHVR